jgi:DNA-binding protein HU-beta
MKKSELVAEVSQISGLSRGDAEKAVNAICDAVQKEVAKGGKVQLMGFGSFEGRLRAARKVRIPSTGETREVGETRVPIFKPGKLFKDMMHA